MGVTTGFAHGKVCCHSKKMQQTALKTPKEKKNHKHNYPPNVFLRAFVNFVSVYGSRVMTAVH